MRRFIHCLLLALLSVSASFAADRMASDDRGDSIRFPEIPGYAVTFESTVFGPSNLWEFIDGAAELFLPYGFVDLHVAYYRSPSDVEIRVEIYRHDSPAGAFGIYSQERSPGNAFVDIGLQGYTDEGTVNFLSGSCYVKLSSNAGDSTMRHSIVDAARRIAATLGDPGFWPGALSLLPAEQRVRNSEQLIAESYLGYGFLRRAYVARYGVRGDCEVFLIPTESEAAAAALAGELAAVNHVPPGTSGILALSDAHQGEITLVVSRKGLAGIHHCNDESLRTVIVEFLQTSLR